MIESIRECSYVACNYIFCFFVNNFGECSLGVEYPEGNKYDTDNEGTVAKGIVTHNGEIQWHSWESDFKAIEDAKSSGVFTNSEMFKDFAKKTKEAM